MDMQCICIYIYMYMDMYMNMYMNTYRVIERKVTASLKSEQWLAMLGNVISALSYASMSQHNSVSSFFLN